MLEIGCGCPTHTLPLTYFCIPCRDFVCQICVEEAHRDHRPKCLQGLADTNLENFFLFDIPELTREHITYATRMIGQMQNQQPLTPKERRISMLMSQLDYVNKWMTGDPLPINLVKSCFLSLNCKNLLWHSNKNNRCIDIFKPILLSDEIESISRIFQQVTIHLGEGIRVSEPQPFKLNVRTDEIPLHSSLSPLGYFSICTRGIGYHITIVDLYRGSSFYIQTRNESNVAFCDKLAVVIEHRKGFWNQPITELITKKQLNEETFTESKVD